MFCACSEQIPVLPDSLVSNNVCLGARYLSLLLFLFRGTCADTPRWEMAADLEPLMAKWLGAEKAEDTREGSLEPQIEDLIHRINELQQGPAKKRSSEELGEAQALQKAMHQELVSLNEEKVHLEEVLCKKQDALSILQNHPQERERETPCLDAEQPEERLEDLTNQHKDLWEFHVLQQRLAQEISMMRRRKDQLLLERTVLQAKLKEVEQRLQEAREAQNSPGNCGLKTEPRKLGGQSQSSLEAQNDRGEAGQEEQHHVASSGELPRTGTPC
ncbi:synaptonemal complex central element protein 1-like isoform X2 [Grammomys surdaster]|uniref:synaptonemal complex central element protein 1-like isoform X2 n=1 Tax=Grammomys surdaster TaxID=491861 RepID=UPI0010A07EA2|nr:synaptonemal complex central element protein 1-like isoform X2 [Grammomys surdaster]